MTQKIRPSQFVTTYGPGSIIELPEGPVIIPDADIGLFVDPLVPRDYEIVHKAMSTIILKNKLTGKPGKIFGLPTNESLNKDPNHSVYRTKPFPTWKLCLNYREHRNRCGQDVSILYKGNNRCHICEIQNQGNNLNTASPVRFVTVCKAGHLDEVSWDYHLHREHPNQTCPKTNIGNIVNELRNDYVFFWRNTGGTALKDILIECPRCNTVKSFGGDFYYRPQSCSGRHPESEEINSEPFRNSNCKADAKIMQRQAASIRMPVIKTLLSIQSRASPLHDILEQDIVETTIDDIYDFTGKKMDNKDGIDELLLALDRKVAANKFEFEQLEDLKHEKWETLVRVIQDLNKKLPVGYHGLVMEEFDELYKASIDGAPPTSFQPRQDPKFLVNLRDRSDVTTKGGHTFVVLPISILETVSVQTGYKRDDTGEDLHDESEEVPSSFEDETFSETLWFPGVRYTGEGIFIRLDDDLALAKILQNNPVVDKWRAIHHNEQQDPTTINGYEPLSKFLFRDSVNSKDELHPGFVWWHTLSHLLIRIISEECGYSSASIRERIYFKIDDQNNLRGGILLYAAQPGSEGTLGGLTSLVSYFDSFIKTALEKVSTCSADPLCSDSDVAAQKINGACCYGCLMNSETSCEHRNMWLDRNVLGNSLP